MINGTTSAQIRRRNVRNCFHWEIIDKTDEPRENQWKLFISISIRDERCKVIPKKKETFSFRSRATFELLMNWNSVRGGKWKTECDEEKKFVILLVSTSLCHNRNTFTSDRSFFIHIFSRLSSHVFVVEKSSENFHSWMRGMETKARGRIERNARVMCVSGNCIHSFLPPVINS